MNNPTHELSLDEWEHVMAVNTTAVIPCTEHAIPRLKQVGGSSINISAIYGIFGGEDIPP